MNTRELPIPLSNYSQYCDGYGNPGNMGAGYVMGFVLGVGKSKLEKGSVGSTGLEGIDAFDKAEVEGATIGQINMITVSSFNGPQGMIWGYDLARHAELYKRVSKLESVSYSGSSVRVYSLEPLLDATRRLFGTVDDKRFPLIPGSHVPCAAKDITIAGPSNIYCSLSIGIAKDREKSACLLMEDIGTVDSDSSKTRRQLMEKSAISVLKVGKNQLVEYAEVFSAVRILQVKKGEIGCCLAAAPYFALARGAVPVDKKLSQISLGEWEQTVF